jgi:transposase-like protein
MTADMNLPKLIETFGSEDKCRAFLEELRWPEGVRCPRCESDKISRIVKRKQFDCDSCRYQFSVTAGTLFHDSHLPLWKWFLAIYLISESKKGISAKQLQRMLSVSYKTAWYLSHRVRDAMGQDDQPLLSGIVEVDETLIGGKRTGVGSGYRANKATVAGAVQRGGEVRLRLVPNQRRAHLHKFISENVAGNAEAIYSDELASYKGIGDADTRHETVNHSADEFVRGEVHSNTVEAVWSLFKRSLIGSYHQVSVKHLPGYLDEMEFRFNGRHNPFLFRDTLLVLLHGDALPYSKLIERQPVKGPPPITEREMRQIARRIERHGHA